MRVLVVEDEASIREGVCEVVAAAGHTAVPAADGNSAWSLFLDAGADTILSDWLLPGCSGTELCRRVRGHPRRPYAYFILLTALSDKRHMFEGREAGADDYLAKPFDLADVEVRLRVAERALLLLRERETLMRLEGVLLAAHTAQHELNNRLALTAGYAELLERDPRLPPSLHMAASEALRGAQEAAAILTRLCNMTELREVAWGPSLAPTLDLGSLVPSSVHHNGSS